MSGLGDSYSKSSQRLWGIERGYSLLAFNKKKTLKISVTFRVFESIISINFATYFPLQEKPDYEEFPVKKSIR